MNTLYMLYGLIPVVQLISMYIHSIVEKSKKLKSTINYNYNKVNI